MKISKKTQMAKLGIKVAETEIAVIHKFYLRDNALEYLNALINKLKIELGRRKVDWIENEPHRKAIREAYNKKRRKRKGR